MKIGCILTTAGLALATFIFQPSTVFAQNITVTYQGRVTNNGTNFNGAGQFKFAIVTSTNNSHTATANANLSGNFVTSYTVTFGGNGYVSPPAVTITGGGGSGATATANISGGVVTSLTPGIAGSGYTSPPTVTIAAPPDNITFTTYWSNDGTSAAGSEPTAAVSASVAGGLFTVGLGDTTLANMMALSAALFTQPNLQLRIWFNDGVNGFAVLNPVQNLTVAPYAAFSQTASNLTGTLASANLVGTYPGAVTFNNAGNSFAGSGAGLTSLNASQLTSGTVADARLSANVALRDADQTFTGMNTFNHAGNNFKGTFSGNGTGVTNLNLSLNSGGAIIGSGVFALSSSPGVGSQPASVAAADVNGDGKVDLITANFNAITLTVLTNNGSGSFVLSSSPSLGNLTGTASVTAVDVNGDGKVDLITANSNTDRITVLTNNGSGGFAASETLFTGVEPREVTAADVNGDGKVDLISANFSANTLTVFTNNGSGGFALSSSPGAGNSPASVTASDVNGDGLADLISANFFANTLTVLTNNGSGGFVAASSPGVGSVPNSVTAADVNGDGRVDLINANGGDATLTVLTNNGSGSFTLSSSPGVGFGPLSVTAADVNGDGLVDLISANLNDTLSVLTNNGSGGFALSSSPGVGLDPFSVTAADVNGDGRADLISANQSANTLTVLFNVAAFTGNFAGNFPNGNVGIGTTTPQAPLHIASDAQAVMILHDTGSDSTQAGYISYRNGSFAETAWVGYGSPGSPDFSIVNARASGDIVLFPILGNVGISRTPTTNKLEVEGNASKTAAGSWLANSDARIKTAVQTVTGALDKLSQVRLVEFHYTEDYRAKHPSLEDRSYLNVVAQEFQKVFPEHVQSSGEKLPGGGDAILQVDTYPLTIYSAAAIQELNQKLARKETEIAELEARLEKLEQLIAQKPEEGAK